MKKVFKRLWFWIIWAIIGLLVDEYIKEGYLFKAEDIFNNHITHEKIILLLILALAYMLFVKNRLIPEKV